MQKTFRAFYELTKPRVTYGNVLTAVAGYFLAAAGSVNWTVFFAMTIGTTLVIASACAINNFLDQDIDRLLERLQVVLFAGRLLLAVNDYPALCDTKLLR